MARVDESRSVDALPHRRADARQAAHSGETPADINQEDSGGIAEEAPNAIEVSGEKRWSFVITSQRENSGAA